MLPEFLASVSLLAWCYLALLRGFFWRIAETPPPVGDPDLPAKVIALIPARNEAALIGHAVQSLITQDFCGEMEIVVIDDNSSDSTREHALQAAASLGAANRVEVIAATPPPAQWTGKLWALSQGLDHVRSRGADYLLFTDADIQHAPDNVRQLVARAQSGSFDLVSLMVKLRCESFAERALIPAFLFFFLMLYPPAWVCREDRRTAAAAGGCILIRPAALARVGGLNTIRGQLIDDCALARCVKQSGGRICLGTASRTRSLRAYERLCDVEQMLARTAFTQLRHSAVLLVATLLGMGIVFVAPIPLLFSSRAALALSLCSWLLMSLCFMRSLMLYRVHPLWAPMLPAISLFYLLATVHSAILYWRGRGGAWKGRIQGFASG
jgi:hopene-associated glycosyltransferase HpnB